MKQLPSNIPDPAKREKFSFGEVVDKAWTRRYTMRGVKILLNFWDQDDETGKWQLEGQHDTNLIAPLKLVLRDHNKYRPHHGAKELSKWRQRHERTHSANA